VRVDPRERAQSGAGAVGDLYRLSDLSETGCPLPGQGRDPVDDKERRPESYSVLRDAVRKQRYSQLALSTHTWWSWSLRATMALMTQQSSQPVTIPVVWPDVDEKPVFAANAFVVGFGQPGEMGADWLVLTLGHVAPPVVLGTQEQQNEAMQAIGSVKVNTLARVALSRSRARQLAKLLADNVDSDALWTVPMAPPTVPEEEQ